MGHTNFDSAELEKFEKLADRWWDPQSEFRPLHEINPLRLQWIDDTVSLPFKRVLDVGCGGGILAESMARRGAHVLGIDLADRPLKVAALHARQSDASVAYRAISAEELALERAGSFDVVTCMEMLEHVPEPASVVKACADLAKPGATLVFSTLNKTWKAYLMAIVGAEQVLKLVPKGTHEFEKFIRPSDLMRFIDDAGLQVVDATGLHYNPINQSFRTGPGLDVNYFVVAKKPL